MISDDEMEEFKAWKRAKNATDLERIFQELEHTLDYPETRKFSTIMPSQAYRLLASAIILLKKELIKL